MHKSGMISIWFFIGVLLVAYGVLILGAGIYELAVPQSAPTVLAELHAGIWWGGFILALGALYTWRFYPRGGKAVRFEVPPRVQAYVQAIVETCAHGGMELVSLVLFGSAAIGGWREGASDADLILVVPDGASDESRLRLRCEVERIELLHGLRIDPDRRQGAPEIMLNKVTATDKSFFICAGPSAIVVAKG